MRAEARPRHVPVLALLAALAVLAYLPLFTQPLLQDDYPNIEIARQYGAPSSSPELLDHPIFRYRATSIVLAFWADRLFGVSAAPLYAVSIALHVLAAWLLYALGQWPVIGWRVSAVAAAFFAIQEGHQEAVMWYSAVNELLMFLFAGLAFLCWVKVVEGAPRAPWFAAAVVSFVLALASKESAVVTPLLLLLPLAAAPERRKLLPLWLVFAGLAGACAAWIAGGRSNSFRFQDGSFSLSAPFWITWPVSYGRLLWIWGVLALLAVVLLRAREHRRLLTIAAVWIAIALAPYSFLTYMHRIPSRQTYLASAGLAWIVAAGFLTVCGRLRSRPAMAVVAAAVLMVNLGTLWTRKRRQFLERAAPTEALIALARRVSGPIYVRCYPDPRIIAESAVRLRSGKPASILIWDAPQEPPGATVYCWK